MRSSMASAGLLSLLVGCGPASSKDPDRIDHTYAISAVVLPRNASQALAIGLDVDEKPNDGVDNQLGSLLATLASLEPGLDLQALIDARIDRGTLLPFLADLQATDLLNARNVDLWIYPAATDPPPKPSPCTDPNDTVC